MHRSTMFLFAAMFLLLPSTLLATDCAIASNKPLKEIVGEHAISKEGLFPLAWDPDKGKLYLKIPKLDEDFLYITSLPYGLGVVDMNNPGFGLDRGAPGDEKVVHFSRFGPRVLLIQPNLGFRSSSPDSAERLAVRQSFAETVIASFCIAAVENGQVLIDGTDFFLSDSFDAITQLKKDNQGDYQVDSARSSIVPDNIKNFPLNTEVESMLTLTTQKSPDDSLAGEVVPDPRSFTLREHYSFIRLPDNGYKPRIFDPRAGYFDNSYRDFSTPLGSPLDRRFTVRYRLEKKDPSSAMSEPTSPIVYYVDSGVPEPIRGAIVEGAGWWNEAFEAAGFKNAFRVQVLPKDADPMDIRYNVIQWVDRTTRGWSYGTPIIDPRTGEIIQGRVTFDAMRARQDYLIAEALLSPYRNGVATPSILLVVALARIRQLAAHEVGHTLGLAHNFVASSIAPGTSVMDYPHPRIGLDSHGSLDLSHAYSVGIGTWDKAAIQHGYTEFSPGVNEAQALDQMVRKAQASGLYYITDGDSRPPGSAHPYSHLWDNGPDPAAELERILEIRAAALKEFGEDAIPVGVPMSQLADTLVPLYLLHRYQTVAAAKEVAGLDYRYVLRGDGQSAPKIVDPVQQRKALNALLKTLSPNVLALPESLLQILPPRPPAYPGAKDAFTSHTGVVFDPGAAAEAASEITLALLFDPERASRLVEYHARDAANPSLQEVVEATIDATWKAPRATGWQAETQSIAEVGVSEHLLALAADEKASSQARAIARAEVVALKTWLSEMPGPTAEEKALQAAASDRISQFLSDPQKIKPRPAPDVPPGQPIGAYE